MKGKIIAVDDSASTRFVLDDIFREQYDIDLVSSGKELWKLLETEIPDVILLDIMMPDENGFEIAEKLSNMGILDSVPLIFITSRGKSDDVVRGFDAGAYDYIRKPFDEAEVLMCVKNAIAKRSAILKIAEQDPR